jgi:hypothetical protein
MNVPTANLSRLQINAKIIKKRKVCSIEEELDFFCTGIEPGKKNWLQIQKMHSKCAKKFENIFVLHITPHQTERKSKKNNNNNKTFY